MKKICKYPKVGIKTFIIVIFLIFTFVLLINNVNSASCISESSINVQNIKIKKMPSDINFVGVNWFINKPIRKDLCLNPDRTDMLAQNLKELNVNILRYPGGNPVFDKFWDVSYEDIYKAENITSKLPAYKLTLAQFLDFCKKNGFKATVQLNTNNYFDKTQKKILPLKKFQLLENGKKDFKTGIVDWTLVQKAANNAAEEVKWANSNYPNVVLYWEMGNEEYLRSKSASNFTGAEYAKVVAIFIKEINKLNIPVKFIITSSTGAEMPKNWSEIKNKKELPYAWNALDYMYKWNTELLSSKELESVKNDIYAISAHIYPFDGYFPLRIYSNFRNSIAANPKLDTNHTLNKYRELLNKYGYKNTKIIVNEFNDTNYKGCPYAHTWLAALGDAKMIMSCAVNPNCLHMDYHELFNQGINSPEIYKNEGYGLLHYAADYADPIFKYPVANVISMLNQALKGDMLKTNSDNKNIYAVTSADSDMIKVILLNMGEQADISLKLGGLDEYKYVNNRSLGINIPETFTIINTGESMTNPSEIRVINELTNAIKVKTVNNTLYDLTLPAKTINIFLFKK